MRYIDNLSSLAIGETAVVKELYVGKDIYRRLLDIGLIKETKVSCIGKSPAGDPKAYLIRGAVIALRSEDAQKIIVELT